jgi:hypothetical protein
MPTTSPPPSAQANARHCLITSLASSPMMTSSPSLQFSIPMNTAPVSLEGSGSLCNGVVTCRSVHDTGLVLVVFAGVTAFVPPIHWDHSVDTNIGLGHPVPHPRPFRWWILFGGFFCFLCFGGTWGILLPLVLLEAHFGRQFSWLKFTFFLSSIFVSF